MYIDIALINDFEQQYPNAPMSIIEELIERCGIWFPAEGLRAETEDFDITLEEICKDYYFIIDKNSILFCSPDQLWVDIEEELKK